MFPISLTGRMAVVCGASQGIGLAAAEALASLGATCILMARNEGKLKQALAALPVPAGQKHRYVVADFSKPEAVEQAADQIAEEDQVHILVNNTGGPPAGPIVGATPEQFLAAFNQHLICNQILAKTFLQGMKEAGYGRIVNVVSTSVKIPLKGLGVSNTIRGAVASWAKTWANEVGQFGITVNCVLPGATATGRLEAIIAGKSAKTGQSSEGVEAEMLAEIPAGRFGEPEEIAALIAFLSSEAGAYINGTAIPVDGGRTGSI